MKNSFEWIVLVYLLSLKGESKRQADNIKMEKEIAALHAAYAYI